MPEYSLREGMSATFPNAPLTIRVGDAIRLHVRARAAGAELKTVSNSPGMVYVPVVSTIAEVLVSRRDGRPFSGSEMIGLMVSSGEKSGDPCTAFLPGLQCEGQVDALALTLEPSPERLRITVSGDEIVPAGVVGRASGIAARMVRDGWRPNGKDVALAVDASASMRPWVLDGSLRTVADLFSGIDHAIGRLQNFDLKVGQGEWTSIVAAEAGKSLQEVLASAPATSGFSSKVGSPSENHQVFLLTDAVPADFQSESGQWVVLLVRPGAEELLGGGGPRIVSVPVPQGKSLEQQVVDHSFAQSVVGLLAAPLLDEGERQ